jgi:tetratricopeptide (TPR) repeat protein
MNREYAPVTPRSLLPTKILVVDSDPMIGRLCQNQLKRHNISVLTAQDLGTALYHFNQNKFDVALVEINFRDLPGLVIIQKWREHKFIEKRQTGFICLANRELEAKQERLINELGDIELSRKPIPEPKLLPLLSRALTARLLASSRPETINKRLQTLLEGDLNSQLIALAKSIFQQSDISTQRHILQGLVESPNCQKYLPVVLGLLAEKPSSSLLQNSAGRLYDRLGRPEMASKHLEIADQLAPHNIGRLFNLASIYLRAKEPVKAAQKFRELVELSPEIPDLKFDAMKHILDAGFQKTATEFGQRFNPPADVMKHYNNKGVALSKAGKYVEALLEYENAIRLLPESKKNSMIYYNMALAHIKTDRPEKFRDAIACLSKSLLIDPFFEKAKIKLADLKAGDPNTSTIDN